MYSLKSVFLYAYVFASASVALAGDGQKTYNHEEKPDCTHGHINVFLKEEERKKLKNGSLYELFFDFDQIPKDAKDAFNPDHLPALGNKDKLALRGLNRDFRQKFILVLRGYDQFDLEVSTPLSLNKINTTKYPYGYAHKECAFAQLPLENQKSQLVCDLMKEKVLFVDGFSFANQNPEGFREFLDAVVVQSSIGMSGLGEGYTALLAEKLPINNHVEYIGVSGGRKSTHDRKALGHIVQKSNKLKTLYLRDGGAGDEGVAAISKALKNNSTVMAIDLCGNGVTGDSVQKIGKMLAQNKALIMLDLYNNKLTLPDIHRLREAAKKNTTLKRVYIGSNSYHDNPDWGAQLKDLRDKDERFSR